MRYQEYLEVFINEGVYSSLKYSNDELHVFIGRTFAQQNLHGHYCDNVLFTNIQKLYHDALE